MSLVYQLPQEVKNELMTFIETNKDKLNLIADLDFKKKMEYWKKLFNIIQKYKFEIFFRELELIIRFCFLASSDTKYMPYFNKIRIIHFAQEKFKIINLLKFEKVQFSQFEKVKCSLRANKIELDKLYNF